MSTIEELKNWLNGCEAIIIGAGSGLSTAAGFEYGGETFEKNFAYMNVKYGYTDMYTAGFHPFRTSEEKWGYWSKMIYLNRYKDGAKPLYKKLLEIVKDKNYFVITTNVDHQFQLAGFDKKRLFYTQGDYGLFQCSRACHQKTYDNKDIILKMIHQQRDHRIPKSLIPHCPVCGAKMETNLRCDDLFVQDKGWDEAQERYYKFINDNMGKKVLLLELGVGYSTPVWIKYPFMRWTAQDKQVRYVVIDKHIPPLPEEIENQSLFFQDDIKTVLESL